MEIKKLNAHRESRKLSLMNLEPREFANLTWTDDASWEAWKNFFGSAIRSDIFSKTVRAGFRRLLGGAESQTIAGAHFRVCAPSRKSVEVVAELSRA